MNRKMPAAYRRTHRHYMYIYMYVRTYVCNFIIDKRCCRNCCYSLFVCLYVHLYVIICAFTAINVIRSDLSVAGTICSSQCIHSFVQLFS